MPKIAVSTFEGKPCCNCGGATRRQSDGRCLHCRRARSRKFQRKYYNKYGSYLYSKLGISMADYHAMCEEQNWSCLICGTTPNQLLHLDHCHQTMKIRGLLCGNCNRGLGLFGDDPSRLEAAIRYLKNARAS